MKLKELLTSTEWEDIKECLIKNYPNAIKSITGFKKAYISLLSLTPTPTNVRIFLKEEFNKDFDEEPYISVFGKDGTLNKELNEFKYMNKSPDSEYANSEVEYSIELNDWEEWINMEIDKETLQDYTASDIAAHCLWEMTFWGYNKTAIKKRRNELERRSDELKNMTEEEKKKKLISWEKVKEDIDNLINDA